MSYLFGCPLLLSNVLYSFAMYKCQGYIRTLTVDLVLSGRLHEKVDTIHCIFEPLEILVNNIKCWQVVPVHFN